MNLEVIDLVKTISKKQILKKVSFTASDQDIVGFIGDNGAGKTTTIKCIFQEYILDSGKIFVDGHPVKRIDLNKMAFFPDQNNFPKNYCLDDYCRYNFELSNCSGKFDEQLNLLLDATDLKEYKKAKFKSLSSGMQKRALLVSILITKPKIIILDEPTANLDVSSREEFINLLRMLAVKKDIIVIITSHDIAELNKFVNKLVIIDKGQTILEQKVDPQVDDLMKIYNTAIQNRTVKIDNTKIERIFE